jgi:hypothetical protein
VFTRWVIALLAASSLAPAFARADGPFDGTWREGPMNIQVTVQSWGGDCGPRPQSTSTQGGGQFRVSQDGDHLTFHMRRERTTRGCWSENNAVRRVSSSAQSGTWRIVCRTPQDDSRGETGTYTIQAAGENQLSFRDVSAYDWQLNESRCVATITTTQNFTRVGAAPSQPEPQPQPAEPEERQCTPGAPARITLRPARAEIPTGGEQCFNARVVDAAGCTVRSASVELSVEGPGTLSGRCYRAGDAEGDARVRAVSGALRGEAQVAVRTMDLSEWIARRSESGSVGGGAGDDASSRTAARVSTREREEDETSLLWPAIGLGIALILALGAGLVLVMRKKPRKPGIAGLPGVEISEPGIAARPTPASKPKRSEPPPPGDDLICPTCRRGYPPGTASCPHDASALIPYREFAARPPERMNVCPACGDKFPAHVKFCGKDGTTLEPEQ